MDIATSSAAERIARVLAGQRISANAQGEAESAAVLVEQAWQDHFADALAVLRTLREPSERMAAAGDAATWEAMILAALDEAKPNLEGF